MQLILPIPVKSEYTYLVPKAFFDQVKVGKRVLVEFGKQKIYTALIRKVQEINQLPNEKLKELVDILDEQAIFTEKQLEFMEWIAFYYMCSLGDVFLAALPSKFRVESAFRVRLLENVNIDLAECSAKQHKLLEQLENFPSLNFQEICDILEIKNPKRQLNELVEKNFIEIFYEIEDDYAPKKEKLLVLSKAFFDDRNLVEETFEQLSKFPKQEILLLDLINDFQNREFFPVSHYKKKLAISESPIKTLVKKKIAQIIENETSRLEEIKFSEEVNLPGLTENQQEVFDSTIRFFENDNKPVLLHGVTGSGKTRIYIELIKYQLAKNPEAQILFLLPEIALTEHVIDEIYDVFKEKVGVYHSKYSNNERSEIWKHVLNKKYSIVLGVRSAIYLPFSDLSLIVIDEEHETSYKESERAPRIHGRDAAIYYARLHRANILLGSATPSFESYRNALQGNYYLVELKERIGKAVLPEISVVNMKDAVKKKENHGEFSHILIEAIEQRLQKREQIIIFQNRRGFAPFLQCSNCGHIPKCVQCDITLTWHKNKNTLSCHYCGFYENFTEKCSSCGQYTYKKRGYGTEKVEDSLTEIFPAARIDRMDLDTVRGKKSFRQKMSDFKSGKIDILVGTKMLAKGLDFANVTLVGIVQADNLLFFPDFRAHEYAYHLLKQVSGRAGRSHKRGTVLIQTNNPQHSVIQLLQHDFEKFYRSELHHREVLAYPPFTRLIVIEMRHKNQYFLESQAEFFAKILQKKFGERVLGPDYPLTARLRNNYRMQFLMKVHRRYKIKFLRESLWEAIDEYYQQAEKKTVKIFFNVDPV